MRQFFKRRKSSSLPNLQTATESCLLENSNFKSLPSHHPRRESLISLCPPGGEDKLTSWDPDAITIDPYRFLETENVDPPRRIHRALLSGIFGRSRSRFTGSLMSMPVPRSIRQPVFSRISNRLAIDCKELVKGNDLTEFTSFSDFFSRTLRMETRPLEDYSPESILSPCDGKVVCVKSWPADSPELSRLSQIKKTTYDTAEFLGVPLKTACDEFSRIYGPDKLNVMTALKKAALNSYIESSCRESSPVGNKRVQIKKVSSCPLFQSESSFSCSENESDHVRRIPNLPKSRSWILVDSEDISSSEKEDDDDKLLWWHYCVIYLSPSNYHHFHSPCELLISHRRHFAGEVLPVCEGLTSKLDNVFAMNERIVLFGLWPMGVFIYAPIAAYNVGDIRLKFEPSVRTNSRTSAWTVLQRFGKRAPRRTVACYVPVQLLSCGKSSDSLDKTTGEEFENILSDDGLYKITINNNNTTDNNNSQYQNSDHENIVGCSSIANLYGCDTYSVPKDFDLSEIKFSNNKFSLHLYPPSASTTTGSPTTAASSVSSSSSSVVCPSYRNTSCGVLVPRGSEIGDFRLGSTVVMLFQAPKKFNWRIHPGDSVKVGQLLGTCRSRSP